MTYEKIKYPDGQLSVKITDFTAPYEIKERINSYEDLFFIKSIVEALHARNIRNIHLTIPCLFGQRSDRRFSPNQSFDLKIIAEFINSCNFMDVGILDPHSDVALALIERSYAISSLPYVEEVLKYDKKNFGVEKLTLVSPDAGAYKKVFAFGQQLDLPVIGALKYRNPQGELSLSFNFANIADENLLIVDDICDGGATFIKLSTAIYESAIFGAPESISLYVTHGLFSKGFDELFKHLDHIYCTNSVKDVQHPKVTQFKVI